MKKSFRILTQILVLLMLAACNAERAHQPSIQTSLDTGIINGKPVRKRDPTYWMTARILQKIDGVWHPVCTASILAKDLILTAAHCVDYNRAEDLRIAFGAQPLSFAGQQNPQSRVDVESKFITIAVKNFIIHPEYGNTEYDHDIALVHLASEIPENFKPATLLPPELMKSIKETEKYQVLLVGYGMFSEEPMRESTILRRTIVPARFEGKHLITDQTGGSGGCNGDSGGPAYLRMNGTLYLVGVTHGPTIGVYDCKHEGVWGNPNYDKEFLNQSAESFGSPARF